MTAGAASRRLVLLMFFGYLAIDLGCPFVPGAFSFDPSESVDATSGYRLRPSVARAATPPSPVMSPTLPARAAVALPEVSVVPAPAGWRPHAGRDRDPASSPPPSVDDD